MKTPHFLILAFVISLSFFSCKKESCREEKGTLKDYTGLDGCHWMIELNNGEVIEPVNLDEFLSQPEDGMKLCITYNDDIEMASICMVGKVVSLLSLEVR